MLAYFDGGCHGNPDGYACGGWAIAPHSGVPRLREGAEGGACYIIGAGATNNIAEYRAAVDALRAVYGRGYRGAVILHGDSELVVNQYNRAYRCLDEELIPLLAKLREAVTYFASVEVVRIPRAQNAVADRQSRLAYKRARAGNR